MIQYSFFQLQVWRTIKLLLVTNIQFILPKPDILNPDIHHSPDTLRSPGTRRSPGIHHSLDIPLNQVNLTS